MLDEYLEHIEPSQYPLLHELADELVTIDRDREYELGLELILDALERRVTHNARAAACASPTLATKKITPHVLRHTAAMRLLNG